LIAMMLDGVIRKLSVELLVNWNLLAHCKSIVNNRVMLKMKRLACDANVLLYRKHNQFINIILHMQLALHTSSNRNTCISVKLYSSIM
jgi:hypothetical protein